MFKKLKIGLALSGGTAKASAHVGAIKALHENNIPIEIISGTSGGAIAATAYAAGIPLDEMEKAANEIQWGKITRIKFSRLGFVSSDRIEQYMIEHFGDDIRFEDLKIPCAVTGTDLDTGVRIVFKNGPVAKAVRISCSLPNIFLPVEHNDKILIDGGLSEYLPIQTARDLGADFVIGINLGAQGGVYTKPKHIFQLFMQVNNLVAKQNMRISANQADFLIEPDLNDYGSFDFSHSQDLINLLYKVTNDNIDNIKEAYRHKYNLLHSFRFRKLF